MKRLLLVAAAAAVASTAFVDSLSGTTTATRGQPSSRTGGGAAAAASDDIPSLQPPIHPFRGHPAGGTGSDHGFMHGLKELFTWRTPAAQTAGASESWVSRLLGADLFGAHTHHSAPSAWSWTPRSAAPNADVLSAIVCGAAGDCLASFSSHQKATPHARDGWWPRLSHWLWREEAPSSGWSWTWPWASERAVVGWSPLSWFTSAPAANSGSRWRPAGKAASGHHHATPSALSLALRLSWVLTRTLVWLVGEIVTSGAGVAMWAWDIIALVAIVDTLSRRPVSAGEGNSALNKAARTLARGAGAIAGPRGSPYRSLRIAAAVTVFAPLTAAFITLLLVPATLFAVAVRHLVATLVAGAAVTALHACTHLPFAWFVNPHAARGLLIALRIGSVAWLVLSARRARADADALLHSADAGFAEGARKGTGLHHVGTGAHSAFDAAVERVKSQRDGMHAAFDSTLHRMKAQRDRAEEWWHTHAPSQFGGQGAGSDSESVGGSEDRPHEGGDADATTTARRRPHRARDRSVSPPDGKAHGSGPGVRRTAGKRRLD
jgi:hypothetical protein